MARPAIAPRRAWQNDPEALFGGQRRMADRGVAHAGSWSEPRAVHDLWVADDNDRDHCAHPERAEDRRSPAAVRHRVCGKPVAPAERHRLLSGTRFGRVVDRAGSARFRRWRVDAARGLGGEPVAAWLDAEHLAPVDRDGPRAQDRVADQPDQRRRPMVTPEQPLETPHRSPQPPPWTWGAAEGRPVLRLPA